MIFMLNKYIMKFIYFETYKWIKQLIILILYILSIKNHTKMYIASKRFYVPEPQGVKNIPNIHHKWFRVKKSRSIF